MQSLQPVADVSVMTDETQRQIDELMRLRNIRRRNLQQLQEQAALYGALVPLNIASQIEDTDKSLAELNRQIVRLQLYEARATQEAPPPAESMQSVSVVPSSINERLNALALELRYFQDLMRGNFGALQVLVDQERVSRETWQTGAVKRHRGLRWLVIGIGVAGLVFGIVLGVMLGILVARGWGL